MKPLSDTQITEILSVLTPSQLEAVNEEVNYQISMAMKAGQLSQYDEYDSDYDGYDEYDDEEPHYEW